MKRFNILLFTFFVLLGYHQYTYGAFHKAYIDYQLLTNNSVVVMYTADWCPACQQVKPILENMEKSGLIKLVFADVDKEEYVQYNVLPFFIPQISIFRKGRISTGQAYYGEFPRDKQTFMQLFSNKKSSNEDLDKLRSIAESLYD